MCLPFMRKLKILRLCLLVLWLQNSAALRLKPGKHTMHLKDHKASRHNHVNNYRDSSQASRRSTYRINMPMKVAKLLLPQISNKNQETIIRIYPDKSAESQTQTQSNYVLSLSYKKFHDDGQRPNSKLTDFCPGGGCCCCPGSNIDPMSICRPGCPICPTPCVCCCCSSSSPPPPPPPPPPPKKPPPAPCPMVCLPICCPCPKPPCPCRPHCIRRPILIPPCHPPCRIPAPPITGPIQGPCIAPPMVMGPCHPPCFPQPFPQQQRFPPIKIQSAPPIMPNRPIIVDHPMKGPPIFIDQCRDIIPECRQYAKRGMCNHPSPFHTIKQIRKICPFSCGICNNYDENAALLRRHTHSKLAVLPELRSNLDRALEQIIRNTALEAQSTIEPNEEKPVFKEPQTGQKKSHDPIVLQAQSPNFEMLNGGEEEEFSASGGSEKMSGDIPTEIQ